MLQLLPLVLIYLTRSLSAGIGWAVVLIAFYTDFFYNVVIAWALHFFFVSITSDLPWDSCGNEWNTEFCYDGIDRRNVTNGTDLGNLTYSVFNGSFANITTNATTLAHGKRILPAQEYFE